MGVFGGLGWVWVEFGFCEDYLFDIELLEMRV